MTLLGTAIVIVLLHVAAVLVLFAIGVSERNQQCSYSHALSANRSPSATASNARSSRFACSASAVEKLLSELMLHAKSESCGLSCCKATNSSSPMPDDSRPPQHWWEPAIAVADVQCQCGIMHKILGTVTSLAKVHDKPCLCGSQVDLQAVRDAMAIAMEINRKVAELN